MLDGLCDVNFGNQEYDTGHQNYCPNIRKVSVNRYVNTNSAVRFLRSHTQVESLDVYNIYAVICEMAKLKSEININPKNKDKPKPFEKNLSFDESGVLCLKEIQAHGDSEGAFGDALNRVCPGITDVGVRVHIFFYEENVQQCNLISDCQNMVACNICVDNPYDHEEGNQLCKQFYQTGLQDIYRKRGMFLTDLTIDTEYFCLADVLKYCPNIENLCISMYTSEEAHDVLVSPQSLQCLKLEKLAQLQLLGTFHDSGQFTRTCITISDFLMKCPNIQKLDMKMLDSNVLLSAMSEHGFKKLTWLSLDTFMSPRTIRELIRGENNIEHIVLQSMHLSDHLENEIKLSKFDIEVQHKVYPYSYL